MDFTSLNALLLPLIRGIAGWLTNAWDDQRIDWPEVKQLIQTMCLLGFPIILAFIGVELADWNDTIVYATALLVTLIDMIRSMIAKKMVVSKRK